MNEWLIWGIVVVVVFGGVALIKYLSTQKKQKDYQSGVDKINKDIAEKVKKDEAEGMKKAMEIRAKAMKEVKKEEK